MPNTYTSPTDAIAVGREPAVLPEYEVVNLLDDWTRLQPPWDEYVHSHPKGCVFHTSQMVRVFQQTRGNKPLALASMTADGRIAALLVSVRVQTLPPPMGRLSSRAVFYAEPLCSDHPDSMKALSQLLAFHDARVRRSVLFAEVRPLFAPGSERVVLERAGYSHLEYLNVLYNVSQPVEDMWLEVHKSAQRAVRQCERRGLTVAEVPKDSAVETLYPLLQLSYGHSGVPLADRSLFEAAVAELCQHGYAKFFAVFDGAAPVAMDVMLTFKDRIYFWYGGVTRAAAGSPCSLLRWFELKWAHDNGFAVCDSGGAGWPNIPYGVRDFKRKFGGDLVQYGRYRKVFAPRTLAMAEKAYNLKRRVFARK
ncbi:MAG: GNAT family N-acetyltransferase [Pirellulales bacterium]|nr:GNAT family N-acetyltransferase [Pirellulales bacterium]